MNAISKSSTFLVQPSQPPTLVDSFKAAMSRLTGALAIVACQADEQPHGLLVSSMTALSVEPPRILFCVRKEAASHDRLLAATAVSLAVLSSQDQDEAEVFARRDRAAKRFASSRWRHDAAAAPHLVGALISLRGHIHQRICAGTHTIFILNVESSATGAGEPLVYYDRNFRQLAADAPIPLSGSPEGSATAA
jgi:flavin reductase